MLKYKNVKLLIMLTVLSTIVIGCNSGVGGSNNNQPTTELPANGLDDLGNVSHINSVLQIIISDSKLRADTISNNPRAPFNQLFTAYDNHDTVQLKSVHKQIVDYIYSLSGMTPRGVTGSPLEVLSGDRYSYNGLGLNYAAITPPITTSSDYYSSGSLFAFYNSYSSHVTVSYADIPEPNKIRGFIYNIGDHYVSYISGVNNWYQIDDDKVSVVSEEYLQRLPAATTDSGIELVLLK